MSIEAASSPEKKQIRKYRFADVTDVITLENYLTSMAAQGIHFKGFGFLSYCFETGRPKATVYRVRLVKSVTRTWLDPYDKELAEIEDLLAAYAQKGWKFIDKRGSYYVFANESSQYRAVRDFDPNPAGTKKAYRKIIRQNLCEYLLAPLALLMALASFHMSFKPVPWFLALIYLPSRYWYVLVPYFIYKTRGVMKTIKIFRYRRHFTETHSKDYEMNRSWEQKKWTVSIIRSLFLAYTIFSLFLFSRNYNFYQVKTSYDPASDLVRLSVLEELSPGAEAEKENYTDPDISAIFRKRMLSEPTFLCPEYYYHAEDYNNSTYEYEQRRLDRILLYPVLSTEFFRFKNAWLADLLAPDLLKEVDRYDHFAKSVLTYEDVRFDTLIYYLNEESETKVLVGVRNEMAVRVRYKGSATVEAMADEMDRILCEHFLEI